jgi:hypothetical protein
MYSLIAHSIWWGEVGLGLRSTILVDTNDINGLQGLIR